MTQIIYCADVIARLPGSHGPFVIVERLGSVQGLALPGGKQEPGETLSETACRELLEETGFQFVSKGTFGTYAEDARDERGRYVSTVFTGVAVGTKRDEPGKTRVLLLTEGEVLARKKEFVFDHFKILSEYLQKERS